MDKNVRKRTQAVKRAFRVRKKVRGNETRPRLSVFRSNLHVYVQVIDDESGATLVSASTRDKETRDKLPNGKSNHVAAAAIVGKQIAERAKAKGITEVSFDRGPYKYHGRVKALADAAREGGLKF